MQSEPSKDYIVVETTKQKHKLKADEYARWLCLIEALEIVTKGAARLKVDLSDSDWIKPLSFQKYIVDRVESMVDEVVQQEKIKLPKNFKLIKPCITSLEPVSQ